MSISFHNIIIVCRARSGNRYDIGGFVVERHRSFSAGRSGNVSAAPLLIERGGHRDRPLPFLSAGVKAAQGSGDLTLAVESAYSEAAMELRARLNYLSMIVTMAPLLGLLGTIFGMIESFNVFSLSAEEPLAITGGIGEALTATAFGLCVAIFALVVHTVFAQRLDHILATMDRASAVTLSALRAGNGDDRHAA